MYTVCRERERGLFNYDLGVVAGLTGQTKVTDGSREILQKKDH